MQAFVHYRLDYCNAIGSGTANAWMNRLQSVTYMRNTARYRMLKMGRQIRMYENLLEMYPDNLLEISLLGFVYIG